MHIPSLKRYITNTYKMFSEKQLSYYWNLGYINALRGNKLITKKETDILADYNEDKKGEEL